MSVGQLGADPSSSAFLLSPKLLEAAAPRWNVAFLSLASPRLVQGTHSHRHQLSSLTEVKCAFQGLISEMELKAPVL